MYETMFHSIKRNVEAGDIGKIATHANFALSGMRSMLVKSKRKILKKVEGPPYKEQMIAAEPKWGELVTWQALKSVSDPITIQYFLHAVDMQYDFEGNIWHNLKTSRSTSPCS